MRKLMNDFGMDDGPVMLHADNQVAISLAHGWKVNAATKHIAVAYNLQRDYIEQGIVALSYVASSEMVADAMTKALPREKLEHSRMMLGLKKLDVHDGS